MSLVFTESWANFPVMTTGAAADITACMANLVQWGYAAAQANANTGPVIRADPLFPDRKMLSQSSAWTNSPNPAATVSFDVPVSDRPLVFGFSFWVPSIYVPTNPGASVHNVFYLTMGGIRLFSINTDLTVRNAAGVGQSNRIVQRGQANYIEFRHDSNEVRVWIDDILVLQQASKVSLGRVALIFPGTDANLANPGSVVGNQGAFGLNHMYGLLEDLDSPNVRLGPTTRVLGVRPSTDVQAQWGRPSGTPSNASVVGALISANPTATLQTEEVGATDFYTGVADASVSAASLVHGIAVKVQAQNLDTVGHAITPLVRSGSAVNSGDGDLGLSLRPVAKFTAAAISAARRLINGAHAVGLPNDGVWIGADPVDMGTFVQSTSNPSNTSFVRSIAQNATGRVVVVTSGPNTLSGQDSGGAVASWTSVAHGSGVAGQAVAVNPADNSFILIGAASNLVRRSTDGGLTWAAASNFPDPGHSGRSIAIRNGVFLVAGSYSTLYTPIFRATSHAGPWVQSSYAPPTIAASNDPTAWPMPIIMAPSGVCVLAQRALTGVLSFHRSPDNGLTWAAATGSIVSTANAIAMCGAFIEDSGAGGGYFVVGTSIGIILISRDGDNWAALSPNTTDQIRAVAPLELDRGFVAYGASGLMLAYTSNMVNTALAPLAPYTKAVSFMTRDPQTGLTWSGPTASAAEFGMRLSK